ncbi:hypothetical protein KY349_01435 [Candidatus Woesearchaeota archaeon]|nr:hypothetical protein [Candidatus Woesearchaeota archaeon]
MSKAEIQELKRQVLATDVSVNNPGIQKIVEKELARWVESYQTKKTHNQSDCYGGPGEIPDQIYIEGSSYTPEQILEHVRARDETGMQILRIIGQYHRTMPSIPELEDFDARQVIVDSVPDCADLDEVVVTCPCGQHRKTYRDLMNDVINTHHDSVALTLGWPEAIMKLYREECGGK